MLFLELDHVYIYVSPHMGTISLCVLGLPICEFLAVPARMHTRAPHMHTAIGFDLSGEMRLSHERKGVRTWGKEHVRIMGVPVCVRGVSKSPYAYCD